jgi:hypothetical protein
MSEKTQSLKAENSHKTTPSLEQVNFLLFANCHTILYNVIHKNQGGGGKWPILCTMSRETKNK